MRSDIDAALVKCYLRRRTIQLEVSMAPPYVSVYYPKAGGSSLKIQLERMLGESLLQDYEHHPLGPHAMEEIDELPPKYKMVHGHFRASRYSRLRNRFLFTFLCNLLTI